MFSSISLSEKKNYTDKTCYLLFFKKARACDRNLNKHCISQYNAVPISFKVEYLFERGISSNDYKMCYFRFVSNLFYFLYFFKKRGNFEFSSPSQFKCMAIYN